nr:hypothetical protein Itr_chr03CG01790 [Ipomoea trifida]
MLEASSVRPKLSPQFCDFYSRNGQLLGGHGLDAGWSPLFSRHLPIVHSAIDTCLSTISALRPTISLRAPPF